MSVRGALSKLSGDEHVDVRMRDGTIIQNVPRNASKAEIERRWRKARDAGAIEDTRPTSFLQGALEGVQKPVTNALRAVSRVNPLMNFGPINMGENIARVAEAGLAAQRSQAPVRGSTAGRIFGGVGATLPLGGVPGGVMAQGATAGVLMSDNMNDPREVLPAAAIGAASAKAGDLLGKGIAKGAGRLIGGRKAIPPKVPKNPIRAAQKKAVKVLADEDVLMSPGARVGGIARKLEDAADTIPLSPTRSAKEASLIDFNRAVYNQVLKPLNIKVNKNVTPGRDALAALDDSVNAAYQRTGSKLQLQLDDALMSRLDSYRQGAVARMGPESARQLEANIDNILQWRARPAPLKGSEVTSTLRDMRTVASSARAEGKQALADTLWSMHDDIENAALRQSPKGAVKLFTQAREAVRRMRILEDAGAKSNNGFITPGQFKSATHRLGYGTTRGRLTRGEAPMQEFADAAALVLPDKLPNSGTAERSALTSLLTTGGIYGGATGLLGVSNPVGAAAAAPAAAYIPPVNRLLQYGRTLPPARVNAGEMVGRSAPLLGRGSAGIATGAGLYPFLYGEEPLP